VNKVVLQRYWSVNHIETQLDDKIKSLVLG